MAVPIANIMEPADWQDREMERLEAENAKLREQLEYACQTSKSRLESIDRFKAENSKLRDELDLCLKNVQKCEECEAMFNCEDCEAMLDCDECLRADASQKERKRLDYENDELRELVRDMATEIRGLGIDFARVGWCDYADRMRELGVEP